MFMQQLKIEEVYQHPKNPRKELGNLEELTDSIKKNGIMQNLTVIKGHYEGSTWKEDKYTLIIGHRRCAAAKQAGLKEIPCKIVENLNEREQVGIMLEENMQRTDLSIYEQGQGFQMMLDLGETKETISQKTGFSRTTIDHRLNIAKLNQKIVKEKTESEEFQLSLQDFYELEKIKKVSERNRILKDAKDSTQIRGMVSRYLIEKKQEEEKERVIELLQGLGVKQVPENEKYNLYSSKWEQVKRYSLNEENIIKLPACELFYDISYGSITIYKKAIKKEVVKTKEEIEAEEKKKKIKELENLNKKYLSNAKKFIIKNLKNIKNEDINLMMIYAMDAGAHVSRDCLAKTYAQVDWYEWGKKTSEEKEQVKKELKGLTAAQILALGCVEIEELFVNWCGYYKPKEETKKIDHVYTIAEQLGYVMHQEEAKIENGTHELYIKSYTKGDKYE